MDVVYVVRPGDANEALRYSLRSLANLPHHRVFIFGHCPPWVAGVHYMELDQRNRPDQENSNNNLRIAADSPFLSDDFIFMNDDFMIMHPTDSLDPLHQGNLDDRIAQYKVGDRFHQAFSLIATRNELRRYIPSAELYSYELHTPIILNKSRLKALFSHWNRPLLSLRPRTMYGNLYHIEGTRTDDVKGSTDATQRFISTSTGFTDAAATLVRLRFPDRGAYERP